MDAVGTLIFFNGELCAISQELQAYQMGSACSVKSIISSWNPFHEAIIYTCILVSFGVQWSSNDTKSMAVKMPDSL